MAWPLSIINIIEAVKLLSLEAHEISNRLGGLPGAFQWTGEQMSHRPVFNMRSDGFCLSQPYIIEVQIDLSPEPVTFVPYCLTMSYQNNSGQIFLLGWHLADSSL